LYFFEVLQASSFGLPKEATISVSAFGNLTDQLLASGPKVGQKPRSRLKNGDGRSLARIRMLRSYFAGFWKNYKTAPFEQVLASLYARGTHSLGFSEAGIPGLWPYCVFQYVQAHKNR